MDAHPLRFFRNLRRSRQIATVLLHHGFGDLLDRIGLGRYIRWGKRVMFFWRKPEPSSPHTRAVRMRRAIETLGPTFIKLGQLLSTRADLLPADVVRELAKLQEDVPPFSTEEAEFVLWDELGSGPDDLFATFDTTPIAAGSLAQVHRAVHKNGTPLAVKIRRPRVIPEVERDLGLLHEIAVLMERHMPEAATFDPIGLVNQFARTIRQEMNFSREGRTIREFEKLFADDATLRVPRVFEQLTSDAVLTMEYIEGWRIDDKQTLRSHGLSIRGIAANGAQIFMKQAFELGVFHGDPHPGNLRILPDGSVCLLDYGMVGVLDNELRERLIDLCLAIGRSDVYRTVELVKLIGHPRGEVDDALLRSDFREFIKSYYDLPLEKVKVGRMLSDFTVILTQHGIRWPSDLMLLTRCLIALEGVGRDLDPDFNLANYLSPFIERIVRQRYSPRRIATRFIHDMQSARQVLQDLPVDAARTLKRLSHGEFRIKLEHAGVDNMVRELDRSGNRLTIGMILSALILASAIVMHSGTNINIWVSLPVFALSSFLGVWLIYGIFRSGRL